MSAPEFPKKRVSLMEILRAYAEIYVDVAYKLGFFSNTIKSSDNDPPVVAISALRGTLQRLSDCCGNELPMTAMAAKALDKSLSKPRPEKLSVQGFTEYIAAKLNEIHSRFHDELSTKLLFQLPLEKRERFDEPCKGWEEALARFPDCITDIEEMNKCFALSRYAASVFHSVQVIESGLINLGVFLQVNDPISGWTAVSNKLEAITKKKYPERDAFEKQHYAFIEQTHGTVSALKNAWRNKISHAHGRLALISSEFSRDTAEEIIYATRAFMRRLATELPQ